MSQHIVQIKKNTSHSPRSKIKGALGPISIATAPTPPVGLAFPVAYTAISPATTRAYRPEKYYLLVYKEVIDTLSYIQTESIVFSQNVS